MYDNCALRSGLAAYSYVGYRMPANILLVEDETALRMTMGDRLRNEGYVVDCAANGDEGFDKATALPFDLDSPRRPAASPERVCCLPRHS